jgi:WD40 repeat protein
VLAVLVMGLLLSAWQAMRAQREERRALYAARVAEQHAMRAGLAESNASEKATDATNALQVANERLVKLNVAEGWRRVEEGDYFGALLPFVEAFALEQDKPDRADIHQMRLASVLQHCPKLVNVWSVGTNINHAEFNRDGSQLLTSSTLSETQALARIWDTTTGRPLTIPMEHGRRINSLQWSADESLILTAGDDGLVCVWDARTGRPFSSPLRHESAVLRARFDAKADKVVTVQIIPSDKPGSESLWEFRGLKLWDVPGSRLLVSNTLAFSGWSFLSALLTPDGREVVTAGHVYDALSGRILTKLDESDRTSSSAGYGDGRFGSGEDDDYIDLLLGRAEFSPSGKRLFIGGDLDLEAGRADVAVLRDGAGPHRLIIRWDSGGVPYLGRFSLDDRRLATANDDMTVRLWNSETGSLATSPMEHRDLVSDVRFSLDGRRLATTTREGDVRVWDTASGKPVSPPLSHRSRGLRVAFNREATQLMVAGSDGTLAVWNLTTMAVPRFTWAGQPPDRLMRSQDGNSLCRIHPQDGATVVDLQSGEQPLPPFHVRGTTGKVIGHEASFTGARMLTIEGAVWWSWNLRNGERVAHSVPDSATTTQRWNLSSSHDGRWVVAFPDTKGEAELRMFNALTGEAAGKVSVPFPMQTAAVRSDGQQIVSIFIRAGRTSAGLIWNLPSAEPAHEFGNASSTVAYSPLGRWIFSESHIPFCAWDPANGSNVLRLQYRNVCAISPDENWVVVDSASGCRIVSLTNPAAPSSLLRQPGAFDAGTFSADSRVLITVGSDRWIRFWRVPGGEPAGIPIKLSGRASEVITVSDGFVTASEADGLRFWRLPGAKHSMAEWLAVAQLFAKAREEAASATDGSSIPSTVGFLPRRVAGFARQTPGDFHRLRRRNRCLGSARGVAVRIAEGLVQCHHSSHPPARNTSRQWRFPSTPSGGLRGLGG